MTNIYPQTCSPFDNEVIHWQNQARTQPLSLIPYLKQMLSQFEGNDLKQSENHYIITQEGPKAVEELIHFLQNQQAIASLQWDSLLMRAAIDHTHDTGQKGIIGHVGSDGSTVDQRISRHGKILGYCGENIDYGKKQALDVVLSLLIDDGVPDRGHRINIYNEKFCIVGCYTGYHQQYQSQTVLNYCQKFQTHSESQNMQQIIDSFMKEDVDFGPIPINCTGYSTKSTAAIDGDKITKTTERTFKLQDGACITKTITQEKLL